MAWARVKARGKARGKEKEKERERVAGALPTIWLEATVRGRRRAVRKRTYTGQGQVGVRRMGSMSRLPQARAGTEAMPQMRTVTGRRILWPVAANCQPPSRQGWPQLGGGGSQ